MTAKDLKNALLQEAVQGKLVPQIASEGNARDLLVEIRKERLSHGLDFANAKSGKKSKKETALADSNPCDIPKDEIPFDIPESWCWCRLGELGNFIRGSGIKRDETTKIGFPCVRYGEMYTTYKLRFSQTKSFTTKEVFDKCHKIYSNDILMALTGENKWDIALAAVYEGNDELAMGGDLCKFTPCKCDSLFLVYLINSPYGIEYKRNTSTGDIIVHTSTSKLGNFIVPLPPLAEQKRIVAAIEKFMPLIEVYGKKETVLNELNAQIGTLTKKAILQEAVQGKLVPQIPAEGNAKDLLEQIKAQKAALIREGKIKKEKPLPEITEDEIPFDIPENWCWCRLSEYLDIRDGTHDSPKFFDVGIPFVTSKNLNNGILDFTNCKFITEEDHKKFSSRSFVENGDILFAMIGSIGNPVIVKKEFDFSFKNMALFKRYSERNTNMKYVYYYLCHIQTELKKIATGGVQSFIGLGTFREMLFPLPPLSEQKRIVEAIEQLLPLCERLGR